MLQFSGAVGLKLDKRLPENQSYKIHNFCLFLHLKTWLHQWANIPLLSAGTHAAVTTSAAVLTTRCMLWLKIHPHSFCIANKLLNGFSDTHQCRLAQQKVALPFINFFSLITPKSSIETKRDVSISERRLWTTGLINNIHTVTTLQTVHLRPLSQTVHLKT